MATSVSAFKFISVNIKDVLHILHNGNLDEVVSLLNKSSYVGDLPSVSVRWIIHTGVKFRIQTGSEMELFFDLEHSVLIRQNHSANLAIPCVLGLYTKIRNGYIKNEIGILFTEVSECFGFSSLSKEYSWISADSLDHKSFKTFKQDSEGAISDIREFPLSKNIEERLFFGNGRFAKLNSEEEITKERKEIENDAFKP
jgi:hypothetical protein